ncbi:MAG TPA: TlyA family rRNA (cytidine-2'-O)-methyltransferase, partial [Bifidobacterium sp.]|nr:TlyA family rRNA (cytidine-2'-O)-methyltransferase [Bifidobacterium sp.]
FEVGKGNLGKNGIVESERLRRQALDTVIACARGNGLDVRGAGPSPIEGTHG